MRLSTRIALAVALVVLAACRDASSPVQPGPRSSQDLTLQPSNPNVVPGQYIVVFKDGVTDPDGLAQTLVSLYGGSLKHTYKSAIKGFAAILSNAAVAALQAQSTLVDYIEPDQKGGPDGETQQTPQSGGSTQPSGSTTQYMDANGDPWGLDRIDQRALPLSGTYTYTSRGAGVHVYLIDSGIWTLHPEFGGRADNVYDVAGVGGEDCWGHGTAVAGIVGSATYGVAKGVFLHGVRVYAACSTPVGITTVTSDVVAGVDWVTGHHLSPAVANLSVSLSPSTALTTAVHSLQNSGVFVAATAANHNADACLEAAGASGAFTVAASTKTDAKAAFSNWGPCVSVYAPGQNIKSTWLLGQTIILSGTSFAAPHVTGVAALYKATFGDAPSNVVAAWISNSATVGVITGNPSGTPNLLLFKSTL
jgi:subtilisin family serine protease